MTTGAGLAGLAGLVRAHGDALERLARRRLGGAACADAPDVVQAAWCQLLERAAGGGPPPRDARGFLVTIVLNLLRDRARAAGRRGRGHRALRLLLEGARAPSAEQVAAARERHAALRAAVAGLPPRTRAVLLLFRVEGLSYKEIAARLAISPRTVEYHVREAVVRLRRELREPG